MDRPAASRRIEGRCHCGNIGFTLDWPDPGPTIPVRACGCSLCVKHGGVWTSNPRGSFGLRIADVAKASRYRFGSRTADFHLCLTCGVIAIVTCEIDGARYAVVNVNTFEGVDRSAFDRQAADFEGEAVGDRLARRRRNWTPEARHA
jgi:hypothetical protein